MKNFELLVLPVVTVVLGAATIVAIFIASIIVAGLITGRRGM